MKVRQSAYWVAALLVVVGAACLAWRLHLREQSPLARGDMLWRITYKARFQATRAGAKVRLSVPIDTEHARVFHEDVYYSGLSSQRLRGSRELAREITLATRRRGLHSLTARFDLHLSPKARFRVPASALSLTPEKRDEWLRATPALPVNDPLVQATLDRLQRGLASSTNLPERIVEFCAREITAGPDDAAHEVVPALRQQGASALARARTLVTLCRAARVPARLVTGFNIETAGDLPLHVWTEVLMGDRWTPYDPSLGVAARLPHHFVPLRRDSLEIVRGSDIAELDTTYTVAALPPEIAGLRRGHGGLATVLDLTRLPLEMHEVLSIILLLPLGALVTAVFRTVIGLRTFGTFTPTLLALSFVYADWRTGLLTFSVVLVIGLVSRRWLERLKLLMVPRLSVILTLVVALITFTVSVLDFFNLTPSAQAVILPMVILTMTIERFYLTSEEDSTAFALQLLGVTVLVGACCYGVLRWKTVGRLVFTCPEVHFFTLAVLIVLGRYSGYRLTELWRFRELREGEP